MAPTPSHLQHDTWRDWFMDQLVPDAEQPPLRPRLRTDERELLERMPPATAELLASRALLRRVDTKFVFARAQLVQVLEHLSAHFDLVLSQGALVANYQSLYFETADRRFFHDHRRGVRPRQKRPHLSVRGHRRGHPQRGDQQGHQRGRGAAHQRGDRALHLAARGVGRVPAPGHGPGGL